MIILIIGSAPAGTVTKSMNSARRISIVNILIKLF